jgi:hypothetical protein
LAACLEAGADGEVSSISSDSGTSLSSMGWLPGPTPVVPGEFPRTSASSLALGKPRAAAAQDSNVVRDARRAASLSAWYAGDMKFGWPLLTRVWDR